MTPSGLESSGLSSPRQGAASEARPATFDGKRQLVAQAVLVACCTAAGLAIGGTEGALGSLLGGTAALAGTLAFLGVLRWRNRPAPTAWEALRALLMAEAAKWAVSLGGLAALLSGAAGVTAATQAPGAVVIGFCIAWVAPLLALVKRN